MKNKFDYIDTNFDYIDESKYKRALARFHQYAEDVLSGKTIFEKSQSRLDRTWEALGDCACAELPQGGICFVDDEYDTALDNTIMEFFSSYLPFRCDEFIIACIRNADCSRADYLIKLLISKKGHFLCRTVKNNADHTYIHLFTRLINQVRTTIVDYSLYAIHEIYTPEMMQNTKELIEKNIDVIENEFEKKCILGRCALLRNDDQSVEDYKSYVESCIQLLPKTYKEWRKDSNKGNRLWEALIISISDYWYLGRYSLAFQMYKTVIENDIDSDNGVWATRAKSEMQLNLRCSKEVLPETEWAEIYAIAPGIIDEIGNLDIK